MCIDAEVNKVSINKKINYEPWSTSRRDEAEELIIIEVEEHRKGRSV